MTKKKNKSHNKSVKPSPLAAVKPDYVEFYKRTFPSKKHLVNSVLEIGFNLDSLKALAATFPNALIHTLDMFNGKSMTKEQVLDAGFFAYAMDEKIDGQKGLSLAAISTKFDIIIDRSQVYNASELMVFNQLYTNNMQDKGRYYIEAMDLTSKENQCVSAAKAIFDADASFSNQYLSQDEVRKLIDITEWCDMDPNEKIAVFFRKADKDHVKKQPIKQGTAASPVIDTQVNPDLQDPEPEIEPELILPQTLTVQLFDKTPTVIQNPAKFGPIRKDIFSSFFGKVSDAPALYEMYRENSDFFFADIPQGSDRYSLEMARSFFTICRNDRMIIDAILGETIPVIITNSFVNIEFWANNSYPCLIICHPGDLQLVTGNVYRNSALMSQYVINGRKLLKALVS